ncbi:MAG: hypothetical protein MZW92_53690 [Comamonadaceae bacterium]|nr:hypothetical protein [Comamonadaceae bacterium]
MADGVTLLIGPKSLAASLAEHPDTRDTELLVFDEDQVCQAVEHMVRQRPSVVALPEKFAMSPRGTALTHRIAVDAQFAGTQVALDRQRRDRRCPSPRARVRPGCPSTRPARGACRASACGRASTCRLTARRPRSSTSRRWERRSCRRRS